MDIVVWVAQIILALVFLGAAYGHFRGTDPANRRRGQEWMGAIPPNGLRTIAALEVLGAIGLVLPAVTGIATWLVPLAAVCFVLLMIFAIIFHARRPGEVPNIAFNAVLGLLAAFVAYGRLVLEPFTA